MTNRRVQLLFLALSGLLLNTAGAPAARAAEPPAAHSATHCEFDGNVATGDPIQCSAGPGGSAAVTFSPVATSVSEGTGDGHSEMSSAELVYDFVITGGSPGDAVPILLSFSEFAHVDAHDNFAAAAIYLSGDDNFQQQAIGAGQAFPDDASFSGDFARVGYVGNVYEVTLLTQMATGAGNPGVARAMVDPYVQIDPTFANADLYSIVVSAGIGNAPVGAVPEPSSWALLASGLAWLALLRQRRRKASSANLTEATCENSWPQDFGRGDRHGVKIKGPPSVRSGLRATTTLE